jgi:hypothetical protein
MSEPASDIVARDVLLRVSPEADRYAIHAGLDERWGRRGEIGFLWCVGTLADGPAARVRLPPDHPDAQDGLPIHTQPAGAALAFRLRANITHKDGRTGKRRSWPREELAPRLAWLDRRAAELGFRADAVEASVARVFIRKGKGFWLDETTFIGRLTVRDPDLFAAALRQGVGQRPAFGFGLLETF